MDQDRNTRISLLLKAARFLHGYKTPGGRVEALPMGRLVALLADDGNPIKKDRLQGFEQLRVVARQMELDAIERVLLLPEDYFDDKLTPRALGTILEQLGDDLDLADAGDESGTARSPAGIDHPAPEAANGDV